MKKMLCLFALLVLVSFLAACGAQAAPVSGSITATPAISSSTPTIQPISSPFVGTYTTTITKHDLALYPDLVQQQGPGGMDSLGTWVLTFKSNTNWTALNGDNISGRQYIGSGHYTVTENQLTFVTDSKCLEYYGPIYSPDAQMGLYRWTLQGNTLTLKAVMDLCTARKLILTNHPLLKQA